MYARYLVTIYPTGHTPPIPLASGNTEILHYELPFSSVLIETMSDTSAPYLSIEQPSPGCLVITDGYITPAASSAPPHSGIYNRIELDDDARQVCLHNDAFAMRVCYFNQSDDVLRFSNSLRLMRRAIGSPIDELGVAETFLLGSWTEGQRTILSGVWRAAGGMEYRFSLFNGRTPAAARRLTDMWTRTIDEPLEVVVNRVCELWERAIENHLGSISEPIGLMLSGGLDSRMVAGGAAARGNQLIALTHGRADSDEMRIAGQVAGRVNAKWISRGIDSSYAFEQFDFDRVNRTNENLFNMMWSASAPALAAEGVRFFTTGAAFDQLLGGMRDPNTRRRFMRNLRGATFGPWRDRPATAEERTFLTNEMTRGIHMRVRNYIRLVAEPYRTMILDQLPVIERNCREWVQNVADSSPISAGQIDERYQLECLQTQRDRNQERQLFTYGQVMLPTLDRDLTSYLTNLPVGIKYDHSLYYRVFRRLYPHLATIPVPNLGGGVDRAQWRIELGRVWRIKRGQRLTPWVNFSEYMNLGDNLTKFESLFLDQSHFFNAEDITEFFSQVRAGQKGLYDGNETTGYLNLAMLLDERRLSV